METTTEQPEKPAVETTTDQPEKPAVETTTEQPVETPTPEDMPSFNLNLTQSMIKKMKKHVIGLVS